MVVILVIRDKNPATEVYPICKTAQTHPGKLEGYVTDGNRMYFVTTYKMEPEELSKHWSACGIEVTGIVGE